ncbi:hypothetical protein L9F63_010854 [Diploptera punctata]|uniref:Glycosyltransferase n=1 Tax=Diploptera punctata TaxID=6984 RepID=A0AAD8AG07_DIPPU|nr:hypothetical protein L9F63_010854 [Diploptera punctata]
MDAGCNFQVSVLGESYSQVPAIFQEAYTRLGSHIINWGHQETKHKYYEILASSHVVVSTAKHEFYGVAMLEATYCGCFPLCPNHLVYPELYPSECLYQDKQQLFQMLQKFSVDPNLSRTMRKNMQIDLTKFNADNLINDYKQVLYPNNEENL